MHFYMLHSDPTPTFSHTTLSTYTSTYETPDTWDCITIVSNFPNIVPAHPLDILPCIAPEPVTLLSPPALGSSWTDWSHVWGGEMCLKRALEKLNLEYPHDSDD
jgi:hypothetical protein